MSTVHIFGLATRGLEQLSAGELGEQPGFSVESVSYRRITGRFSGSLCDLLSVKTCDDLFLLAGEWRGIGHTREMLTEFRARSARLRLAPLVEACRSVRTLPSRIVFSVSANFVGKRNYSSDEVKAACAEGISESLGWEYSPDDRCAAINVRIFIEHDHAVVGIRLGERPLHERGYKKCQIPGSLKPPVAAAMLRAVELRSGEEVVDPCCGAGTILIEAAALGAHAWGGDIDPAALAAAQENSGGELSLSLWDATALPLADNSVEVIVSNPPWDRQIGIGESPVDLYARLCAEITRIARSDARVALLTTLPELVQLPTLTKRSQIEISLSGQRPSLLVFGASGSVRGGSRLR